MFSDIFFSYICPCLGVLMSTLMFAAPINDLKNALEKGKLGTLNPVPWAIMMGNCIGWLAYSQYVRDPYITGSNIPGILVSIWLNMGASKLQYLEVRETMNLEDNPTTSESRRRRVVLVPQEVLVLQMVILWLVILIGVSWVGFTHRQQVSAIGILVNINLLFFYAAPLQTIQTVITEGTSESIHRPMMRMNWLNTSFWVLYGYVARHDIVIYGPNAIGLFFGLIQGILCCIYPNGTVDIEEEVVDVDPQPLLVDESIESTPEPPLIVIGIEESSLLTIK